MISHCAGYRSAKDPSAPTGMPMILVDWQLLDRIARGYIKIDPYDPKLVQPNSLDIRLGNHFVWYEHSSEVIDPYNPDSVASHVGEVHADTFILNPGQFVLAETLECIELPDNIVATIEGKSSIARLGSPSTRPGAGSMPVSGARSPSRWQMSTPAR